jgi:hypothetical protein
MAVSVFRIMIGDSYMVFKSLLGSALLISIAAISAFYIVRRTEASVLGRLPSLLELSLPLFFLGLAMLPEALPSVFASVLHHSIASDYVHPIRADGVQVTETWVIARWWMPISRILFAVVCVGMILAVWNLFRSQDRKLNIFALCLGFTWASLATVANFLFLPS